MGVEAFSLFPHHLEWVKKQPKGKRSAAVRRAIDYWINSGQISIALDRQREATFELEEKLHMARKVGGRRVTLAFLAGYILAHALDLLEYAL